MNSGRESSGRGCNFIACRPSVFTSLTDANDKHLNKHVTSPSRGFYRVLLESNSDPSALADIFGLYL
jgi:hypothetical protein